MVRTPTGETRAKVHEFVCKRILQGTPPSVREVAEAFGFRSSATARQHLEALVDSGALEQHPGQDRGYRIPGAPLPGMVPILGRVRAGLPGAAIELADGYVAVAASEAADCFALTVVGESMAGREIHDGDIVLVRRGAAVHNGDVVVALLDDEATVKTFKRVGKRVVLAAENPDYEDIIPAADSDFAILGRVCEVRRRL